jgi:hypothetical protein
MAELLTLGTLAETLEELRLAWRVRIPEKDMEPMARTWLDALVGLTAESVRIAAKRRIQTNDRFPSVKELRETALEFMARSNAYTAPRFTDPEQCPICGVKADYHPVRRKKVEIRQHEDGRTRYIELTEPLLGKNGQPVLADGKPVLVPIWETITSPRKTVLHDRAAHHVPDTFVDAAV